MDTGETKTPKDVIDTVIKTRKKVRWEDRGYVFESCLYVFPDGTCGVSSAHVGGKTGASDVWMFVTKQYGIGLSLSKAVEGCLTSKPIEV